MKDRYLKFSNSSFGGRITKMLGLPQPLVLDRNTADGSIVDGNVLIGGTRHSILLDSIFEAMASIDVSRALSKWQEDDPTELVTRHWGECDDKANGNNKALIFDATGLQDTSQNEVLYRFFHRNARSLLPCGRVVVFGLAPEACSHYHGATVQRALEGLTRSLGKELKRGITVQLVYVGKDVTNNIESTLRFLLSPRSAYVSGQVIRIGHSIGDHLAPADWCLPLKGKKVLVTGASRGIGASVAQTMSRAGAELSLLDVVPAQNALNDLATKLSGSVLTMDIGREDAPEKLIEAAVAIGGWDVVVHNAGITRDRRIANMKPEVWHQVVNVNLIAQERINDALVKQGAINPNGRIICVSSISGIAGNVGQTNYAMSKAGVIGMVQSAAPVYSTKGITINAVAPGFIETQMTAALPVAIREVGRRANSLNQGGLPVDVAETIAWLACPASSGITGNIIRVCGQSLLGA